MKYQIGIQKCLSDVLRNGSVVIQRGPVRAELFRMNSNKSMHTSLNHKLVWKYRSIRNPYISQNHTGNQRFRGKRPNRRCA